MSVSAEKYQLALDEATLWKNKYYDLLERYTQLEATLMDKEWHPPVEFRLTKGEARILCCLYTKRSIVNRDTLFQFVYSESIRSDRELPDTKIVDVWLSKMRPKVRTYGVEIHTVWGVGYELTLESLKILDNWGKEES